MLTLEKVGNGSNSDIRIYDGTKSFMIARNNLPDLCWYPEIDYYRNEDDIKFTITEEDKQLYSLFEKLYQDVINGNVFPLTDSDLKGKSTEEIEMIKQEKNEDQNEYKNALLYNGLVKDEIITFHSQDYDEYDCSSVLEISKTDNKIEITFKKNKTSADNFFTQIPTYNVRITESYGNYWPFNVIFLNFRRKLQSLTLNNEHEETIEKSGFQKNLKK